MVQIRVLDASNWEEHDLSIGHVYWRSSVSGRIPVDAKVTEPEAWATAQRGNWAAIIVQDEGTCLVTDGPRSFPILYIKQNKEWLISSDPQKLLAELENPALDESAAQEFLNACFVMGDQTLISGVRSVPAASTVSLFKDEVGIAEEHIALMPTAEDRLAPAETFEAFHNELLQAFGKLLEDTPDRQLLVPLSGGADSRLILAVLHELGARNVHTFTYGFPEALEAKLSREVAEGLGYRWHHVTFSARDLYHRWWRPETNSFLQDCWSGSALPHIQDWYALGDLRENPEIEDDAIVLPGHTIVGNEHDDWCFDPRIRIGKQDMAEILAGHHLNQQGKAKKALRSAYSKTKINRFLEKHWHDENPSSRSDVTTAFNLAERQAKYINNSMRGYEHFGFQWALPMLERNPWQLWLNGDKSLHDSARVAYKQYVQEKYTAQAGKTVEYWGVVNRLPKPLVFALDVLDKLRLKDTLEKLYSAHVCLKHPMGLEGFAGGLTKPQLARSLYGGASIIGVYAQLFLEGRWVPNQEVLPPKIH